jgi:hypothetical protein
MVLGNSGENCHDNKQKMIQKFISKAQFLFFFKTNNCILIAILWCCPLGGRNLKIKRKIFYYYAALTALGVCGLSEAQPEKNLSPLNPYSPI